MKIVKSIGYLAASMLCSYVAALTLDSPSTSAACFVLYLWAWLGMIGFLTAALVS